MPLRREKNLLDGKLAELERELREVRRSMRTASRGDRPGSPPDAPDPKPARDAPRTESPDAGHGELFAYATRGRHGQETGPRARRNAGTEDKRKFARYFAGASFVGGMPPMRETRRLQRNKAIFMVIVVIVAAFIIYSIVR